MKCMESDVIYFENDAVFNGEAFAEVLCELD